MVPATMKTKTPTNEFPFRSSIAWLSDWLSTYHWVDYSTAAQDSLPAAGQALPDGLSTRRVPMKGFKVASYISSPFPKLLGTTSFEKLTKRVRAP